MDKKLVAWMLMGTLLQAWVASTVHAQAIRTVAPQQRTEPVSRPASSTNHIPVLGVAQQLKPMFLDKRLFMPDKWWKYEEADEDRPPAFSVEQTGTVSLGGSTLIDHGAQVQYRVREYATPTVAHLAMRQMVNASRRPRNLKRSETHLHQGDEAVDVITRLVDDHGKMVEYGQETIARYGKYVVYVAGRSDLRALGSRPKTGERRWMSEPVHDRVVAAVFARWTRYKTLLASK